MSSITRYLEASSPTRLTHAVWKFSFPELTIMHNRFFASLEMPHGATILSIQLQCSTPTAWALCDTSSPTVTRHFHFVCTGEPIASDCGTYIATVQYSSGLVFHVFELSEPF